MRTLFFLLLFINLAFALYIQFEPEEAARTQPTELPSGKTPPLPAATVKVPPSDCLEWKTFVKSDLANVEAAITRHNLNGRLDAQPIGMAPYYWVHIPPLKNKQHAQRKIGELKRRGVTTYAIVEDDSKWNNAISMGFFEKIEDARAFLAALRNKRVRSAIIGARNVEQVKLVAESPSPDVEAEMEELKAEFPGTSVTKTRCEKNIRMPGNSNKVKQ